MVALDPASGHVVLVSTSTLEPGRAEEFLAALSEATRRGVSQADLDAMVVGPEAVAHVRKTHTARDVRDA